MSERSRATGDVAHIYGVFRRFSTHGRRSIVAISLLSFVGGLAEAGILACVTSVAVATTGSKERAELAFLHLDPGGRLWLAVGLLVFSGLVGIAISKVSAEVSAESAFAARQDLLLSFLRTSYAQKSGNRVAALQEALTTYVDRFTAAFASLLAVVASVLNLVSFAVTAIVINVVAALALLLVGTLVIAVQRPASRRTKRAAGALVRQRSAYAEGATESVLLARELAVFGVAPTAGERLLDLDRKVSVHFRRTRFLSSITPRIYQFLAFGLCIAGLAVLYRSDVKDLTAVAAVALILLRSLSYGQSLLASVQQVAEYRPMVDRLVHLIDGYQAEPRRRGTREVGELREIEFRGTSFGYDADTLALEGVDLTIHSGETLGIVGPSGAGKTTLANLLLRLYEPSAGTILVNGIEIAEVDDDEWHRRTAVVPQEPRLIHGTIADNIRFLRDLPDDAVAMAAAEANIADFVATLPLGYDAPVGELGQGLSGGQRQRICIARALAGRPDLLVLDEPTSALDGDSEAAVQRTLEGLHGKVTMVIVAHRLSTLSICDRIAVVDRGRLLEVGTQQEMRARSTYYRDALGHAGL